MYCVYKHTSPSGKVYIGITRQNPLKRWKYGVGYKDNPHFWNAIIKYGWENFNHEILFDGLTKEEAEQKEIELIALYKSNKHKYGYNRTNGGEGCNGIKFSESSLEKMRISHKGKSLSKTTREKLSKSLVDYYTVHKHHQSGRKRSKESIQKSIETAKKNGKHRISIIQYDGDGNVIKIYASISDACVELNILPSSISNALKGRSHSAGGYVWKYNLG